ncbi:unnamed protein product [Orchesella dallaii]|uniref:Uncharacterized protein n=1 Tax=Orchesella dallaii TaxID=48710 RepID=A0ABP1PUL0_9HEXA
MPPTAVIPNSETIDLTLPTSTKRSAIGSWQSRTVPPIPVIPNAGSTITEEVLNSTGVPPSTVTLRRQPVFIGNMNRPQSAQRQPQKPTTSRPVYRIIDPFVKETPVSFTVYNKSAGSAVMKLVPSKKNASSVLSTEHYNATEVNVSTVIKPLLHTTVTIKSIVELELEISELIGATNTTCATTTNSAIEPKSMNMALLKGHSFFDIVDGAVNCNKTIPIVFEPTLNRSQE